MDLSQVTLSQMRYAVAVLEPKNFKRAASQCHVSQSGLCMQIQKLEELLRVVLFDRGNKPVLVTPEGERVLPQMRTILRETERLGQLVSEQTEPAGHFRLGVIPTLSPTVLPLFLADFVGRYPLVELSIEELKTEEIIARLQMDTLDAGLAATPLQVAGVRERVVGREGMFAYLPVGDPLLKRKSVTQDALSERRLWVMPEGHCFRSQVLSYCGSGARQYSGPVKFESGSFQTLMRLVDEGLGATILPALVVAELSAKNTREQVRPLIHPRPVREIAVVTARTDLRRRVSDALCEIIEEKLDRALGPTSRHSVVLDPMAS
jgi:LysR family hydrogen peroxide-inducible transcriptional activator